MDVVGHMQALGTVPARPIQHEHDLLLRRGADRLGEGGELDFKEGNADRARQVEHGAARGGMDKGHEVAPFVAMLHGSDGALVVKTPDFVQNRL